MQLRDYVLQQVRHHETPVVPFTLGFEGDVAERVDAYYGNQEWRKKLPAYLIEIGVDVLESCQPEAAGMNPYQLKQQWGDKITFWGCLGSQSILPRGTPAQVRAEVGRLCRQMAKGGGYILAPAKALQPETPVENAVAVIEAFTQQ
jgi:uroporphyrinogen-III decarboxylase